MYRARDHVFWRPDLLWCAGGQRQWQADQETAPVHVSLDRDKCEEDQENDDGNRRFRCHAHEAFKGFLLNRGIHFAVFMLSHFKGSCLI